MRLVLVNGAPSQPPLQLLLWATVQGTATQNLGRAAASRQPPCPKVCFFFFLCVFECKASPCICRMCIRMWIEGLPSVPLGIWVPCPAMQLGRHVLCSDVSSASCLWAKKFFEEANDSTDVVVNKLKSFGKRLCTNVAFVDVSSKHLLYSICSGPPKSLLSAVNSKKYRMSKQICLGFVLWRQSTNRKRFIFS